MNHPYKELAPEYDRLLAAMVITRPKDVKATVDRLLKYVHEGRYQETHTRTGIPIIWMAASFEREASSDFHLSPAQGDPWNRVSTHVPKGRGPFANWNEAAIDAYHIDGTDRVKDWSWSRACYEGEVFNGMGYRARGLHSPYLWGGTNIQQNGKYTSDGHWDADHRDTQLGIVPMMTKMVELEPALALPSYTLPDIPLIVEPPAPPPLGLGGTLADAMWLQTALNKLGADTQLIVDGSVGRRTRAAVSRFQAKHNLTVDGYAGKETLPAIIKALDELSNGAIV